MAELPDNTVHERRASLEDRRTTQRQGKLDRRRNRCGSCAYFGAENSTLTAPLPLRDECREHCHPVAATDFACVKFALHSSLQPKS